MRRRRWFDLEAEVYALASQVYGHERIRITVGESGYQSASMIVVENDDCVDIAVNCGRPRNGEEDFDGAEIECGFSRGTFSAIGVRGGEFALFLYTEDGYPLDLCDVEVAQERRESSEDARSAWLAGDGVAATWAAERVSRLGKTFSLSRFCNRQTRSLVGDAMVAGSLGLEMERWNEHALFVQSVMIPLGLDVARYMRVLVSLVEHGVEASPALVGLLASQDGRPISFDALVERLLLDDDGVQLLIAEAERKGFVGDWYEIELILESRSIADLRSVLSSRGVVAEGKGELIQRAMAKLGIDELERLAGLRSWYGPDSALTADGVRCAGMADQPNPVADAIARRFQRGGPGVIIPNLPDDFGE